MFLVALLAALGVHADSNKGQRHKGRAYRKARSLINDFSLSPGLPECAQDELGGLDCVDSNGLYSCECARMLADATLEDCKEADEMRAFAGDVMELCGEEETFVKSDDSALGWPMDEYVDISAEDATSDAVRDLFEFAKGDCKVLEESEGKLRMLCRWKDKKMGPMDQYMEGAQDLGLAVVGVLFPKKASLKDAIDLMKKHGLELEEATRLDINKKDGVSYDGRSFCEYVLAVAVMEKSSEEDPDSATPSALAAFTRAVEIMQMVDDKLDASTCETGAGHVMKSCLTEDTIIGDYFTDAGATDRQVEGVCERDGEWTFDGQKTCVARGPTFKTCDSTELYCAGDGTYGTLLEQALAVMEAVNLDHIHPNCPTWTAPEGALETAASEAASDTSFGLTSDDVRRRAEGIEPESWLYDYHHDLAKHLSALEASEKRMREIQADPVHRRMMEMEIKFDFSEVGEITEIPDFLEGKAPGFADRHRRMLQQLHGLGNETHYIQDYEVKRRRITATQLTSLPNTLMNGMSVMATFSELLAEGSNFLDAFYNTAYVIETAVKAISVLPPIYPITLITKIAKTIKNALKPIVDKLKTAKTKSNDYLVKMLKSMVKLDRVHQHAAYSLPGIIVAAAGASPLFASPGLAKIEDLMMDFFAVLQPPMDALTSWKDTFNSLIDAVEIFKPACVAIDQFVNYKFDMPKPWPWMPPCNSNEDTVEYGVLKQCVICDSGFTWSPPTQHCACFNPLACPFMEHRAAISARTINWQFDTISLSIMDIFEAVGDALKIIEDFDLLSWLTDPLDNFIQKEIVEPMLEKIPGISELNVLDIAFPSFPDIDFSQFTTMFTDAYETLQSKINTDSLLDTFDGAFDGTTKIEWLFDKVEEIKALFEACPDISNFMSTAGMEFTQQDPEEMYQRMFDNCLNSDAIQTKMEQMRVKAGEMFSASDFQWMNIDRVKSALGMSRRRVDEQRRRSEADRPTSEGCHVLMTSSCSQVSYARNTWYKDSDSNAEISRTACIERARYYTSLCGSEARVTWNPPTSSIEAADSFVSLGKGYCSDWARPSTCGRSGSYDNVSSTKEECAARCKACFPDTTAFYMKGTQCGCASSTTSGPCTVTSHSSYQAFEIKDVILSARSLGTGYCSDWAYPSSCSRSGGYDTSSNTKEGCAARCKACYPDTTAFYMKGTQCGCASSTTSGPCTVTSHSSYEAFEIEEVGPEIMSGNFGSGYRGRQSRTRSGRECQRWDAQAPHAHSRTTSNYPNAGLVGNYCRNPDSSSGGIWCYTTDSAKRWEYCDPISTADNVAYPVVSVTPSDAHTFPFCIGPSWGMEIVMKQAVIFGLAGGIQFCFGGADTVAIDVHIDLVSAGVTSRPAETLIDPPRLVPAFELWWGLPGSGSAHGSWNGHGHSVTFNVEDPYSNKAFSKRERGFGLLFMKPWSWFPGWSDGGQFDTTFVQPAGVMIALSGSVKTFQNLQKADRRKAVIHDELQDQQLATLAVGKEIAPNSIRTPSAIVGGLVAATLVAASGFNRRLEGELIAPGDHELDMAETFDARRRSRPNPRTAPRVFYKGVLGELPSSCMNLREDDDGTFRKSMRLSNQDPLDASLNLADLKAAFSSTSTSRMSNSQCSGYIRNTLPGRSSSVREEATAATTTSKWDAFIQRMADAMTSTANNHKQKGRYMLLIKENLGFTVTLDNALVFGVGWSPRGFRLEPNWAWCAATAHDDVDAYMKIDHCGNYCKCRGGTPYADSTSIWDRLNGDGYYSTSQCDIPGRHRCSSCNAGFELGYDSGDGYDKCTDGCTCPNGTPNAGAMCQNEHLDSAALAAKPRSGKITWSTTLFYEKISSTKRHDCHSCNSGYSLKTNGSTPGPQCVKCSCANGVASTGNSCPADGSHHCASCASGYSLNTASGYPQCFKCTCSNGDAVTGNQCEYNGQHKCASCNAGYNMNTLGGQKKCYKCNCPYGTAPTGNSCPYDGAHICTSCKTHWGYYKKTNFSHGRAQCVRCSCDNGHPRTGNSCSANGRKECSSCISGYEVHDVSKHCVPSGSDDPFDNGGHIWMR